MTLSKIDANKIGYKAEIGWYRERIAALSKGFVNPAADNLDPNADSYISILDDLRKKAEKLDKRIDTLCTGMRIPIDPVKDQAVSVIVKEQDPSSGGEFLTYETYKRILEQIDSGKRNLQVEDLIANASNDSVTNSQLIQDRLYTGYANYNRGEVADDNAAERYVNRYLNNMVNWNEHDYQIRQILNFADNYLGTFPDPAYVPWSFKQDTVFEISQIDAKKSLWANYTEIGRKEWSRITTSFNNLTALRPDHKIAGLTDRYIDYTNNFLNGLNDLLNSSWVADLVCCFIKFTKRLDTKTIKGIRAMLQLLKTGFNFEFDDILNSFKDIFNNVLRGLLLNQLVGLINQIIQRLVDPIKEWINNPEDDTWQKIFECTPIRQLIEMYITRGIDYANEFFKDILTELYKDLEMHKIYKDSKLVQAKENKWIGTALKLLDTVIAVMELSASCASEGTPNAEDVQKVMDQFNLGGDEYEYPVEKTPNVYNSFITADQQKEIEEQVAAGNVSAPTQITNQMSTTEKEAVSRRVDDCRKNIRDIDMPKSIVWLEEIVKTSPGRA